MHPVRDCLSLPCWAWERACATPRRRPAPRAARRGCGIFSAIRESGGQRKKSTVGKDEILGARRGVESSYSAWTTFLFALLPLAIGLYGTYEANRAIQSVLDSSEVHVKPDELDYAYRAARITSYVGGALTLILLPLAFAVIVPCCGPRARTRADEP